jgi:tRNA nucleotidyltransferase (CCA-adding enzyme)
MDLSIVPAQVKAVVAELEKRGFEAYIVGGCVRDLLRGQHGHIKDWDVTTSATPTEVVAAFGPRRTIPTGMQHGTVTVLSGHGDARLSIEVTTYRGEGAYSDGRRPDSVTFVRSLEEDLARRDFNMNAIALDPHTGALRDPFDGAGDIAARVIRAVGVPLDRFREDGLRCMRAVRFAAQLEFTLDAATYDAIPGALDVFDKVSMERVRDELMKTLGARRPSLGLDPMQRSGLLARAVPELVASVGVSQNRHHAHDVWNHVLATVDACTPDPVVRLGALLHDVAKPATRAPKEDEPGEFTFYRHDLVGADMAEAICQRLRLSNKDRELVVAMVKNHMFWYSPEWSDATVRRFIIRVGPEVIPPLFALREADVIGRGRGEDPETELGELRRRIEGVVAAAQALKVSDLAIGGRELIAELGLAPGPILGQILRALLDRVVEDPALNDRERLLELARELLPTFTGAD